MKQRKMELKPEVLPMTLTHKSHIFFRSFLMIVVMATNLYCLTNWDSPYLPEQEDQRLTCPDYTFFVEETKQCVPFRNDNQAQLYKQSMLK